MSNWWFPQKKGAPQYIPQSTIVLILGTPKMVPLILVNPHFQRLPTLIRATVKCYALAPVDVLARTHLYPKP